MKNFKIPLITGSIAVIAIIVTVFVLLNGGGESGLYISEISGKVSIVSENAERNAASGEQLKQSDVITVGDGSSCTLVYKNKKNAENNSIILSSNTQIVVTDKLTGKTSGQLYLNRGSLLCNLAGKSKGNIYIRTSDTMVYPDETVTKIAYSTDGFENFTDVYTFMGKNKIQLYDSVGNIVNDPELLIEKRSGQVTTEDLGPAFTYLNVEFPLSDLTAFDLKNLLTIAAFVENFPYTTQELKTAYDNAPDTEPAPDKPDDQPVQSEASSGTDNSEVIQTAEPITTTASSPINVVPPSETTAPPVTQQTTAPTQTTPKPTETQQSQTSEKPQGEKLTVFIIIDDEEEIQEVEYGGDAEQPADPVIEGKTFIGWDGSFTNITSDTTITALFKESSSKDVYHTVTLSVADKKTTLTVKDGEAAPIPSSITIEGYTFVGWDTDYSCIKSDITVTAILNPTRTACTVTFIISGVSYNYVVDYGGTAIPPFTPETDLAGRQFTGWDKALTNITSDTTITAIYGAATYTVTFVIDGQSYPVTVKSGETAVPPFTPTVNKNGQYFIGWDGNFICVTQNTTVTAVFA